MQQLIDNLKNLVALLEDKETIDRKLVLENEMKIMKLERGSETLVERIKEKDQIIKDYKEVVADLKTLVVKKDK